MPGQMPQGQMPQGQVPQGPGGYVASGHAQKTIVAGMAPPIMGGQMMPPNQMMPQGTPNAGFPPQPGYPPQGYPPQPGMPGMAPQGGPNKTVMLQPSEGVVSMARPGQGPGTAIATGASTLYWIVCLATGVAVGVLGYVIVLQL